MALFLTTDFKLTSNEVLEIYRRKDVVEKCLDNLKNAIDMKRLRTHSTETSDGKIFIAFVSLILRSILENVIGDYNRKNNQKPHNQKAEDDFRKLWAY